MANPGHLKILRQGVDVWNDWRQEHIAEFIDIDFIGADLYKANLCEANLRRANLTNAFLFKANLLGADLSFACLQKAQLGATNLNFARLSGANLSCTMLLDSNLSCADLSPADPSGTDLRPVDLFTTHLGGASLAKPNLSGAVIGRTVFGNLDLREVIGLESIKHNGPSTIGIDTLYRSQGAIPDKFLLDAGVPEEIIDIARSIRNGPPIQWHSCFISYSTKDDEFAWRLHSRMREANMRVWFAPEDLKGGKKLHEQLFEAIQIHDRLLIVLSEHSIQSEWVMTEIRKAREVEKKEKRRKLFPIRLTDFETLRDWTCFDADTGKDLAVEVREYFIPDFSNWKVLADGHPAAFESAFARLKKDLEAENTMKS
jgi:hypothetical protein